VNDNIGNIAPLMEMAALLHQVNDNIGNIAPLMEMAM